AALAERLAASTIARVRRGSRDGMEAPRFGTRTRASGGTRRPRRAEYCPRPTMEADDSKDGARIARLPARIRHGGGALAAIVAGNPGRAREEFTRALAAGVPAAALGEVARLAHLFRRFPRALHGLQALSEAL